MNDIKKELTGIMTGNSAEEIIPCYQFNLSKEETDEILKSKPANCKWSDMLWLCNVITMGYMHALNHVFQDYVRMLVLTGECALWNSPHEFRILHFGKAAEQFQKDGSHELFKEHMLSRVWPLEDLGNFGIWMKENNIDPALARDIIKEFLED